MDTILEKLGFKTVIERQKKRISFSFGKLKIGIHQYPQIPPWLELEGDKEYINAALDKLGYKKSQTTSLTDTEILQSYGLDYRYLKF